MAKKGTTEAKIRVHNKSNRDFEIPPSQKGGKIRKLEHGRAVEIEESIALKMIAAYPRDLMKYDDLLSGDSKDLNKENKKLKKEIQVMKEQLESAKGGLERLEELEEENELIKEELEELQAKVLAMTPPESKESNQPKTGE